MPSAAQAQDVRVRTAVSSLQEQVEHMHFNEQPARCRSPCCAPPTPSSAQQIKLERPALNRNAASTHSALSVKSKYSTGTDGTSLTQSEDGSSVDFGDAIDSITFEQILEMDDEDEEQSFSKSIVYDFFTQADSTFQTMEAALGDGDLPKISELGHFLKGSSATLGLTKVKNSCEKIQHFGASKDETGSRDEPNRETSLSNCRKTIAQAKDEFSEAEALLRRFYHDDGT